MSKNNIEKLLKKIQKIHSEDEIEIINKGLQEKNITTFRINNLKSNKEEIESYLKENKIKFRIHGSLEKVYILDKNYEYFIKGSDIFYSGKIYLQSISSMLPVLILDPKKGEKILDLTAAPGSKTTQISSIQENIGEIIAIEKNQIRFDKLNYNIKLQGATNIKTNKIDGIKYLETSKEKFDKILLDAPCSSEGRINLSNPKTYQFWNENLVKKKSELQKKLLNLAIKHLNKGGALVYSTCTISPEENEEVIDEILIENNNLILEDANIEIKNIKKGITEYGDKKYHKELSKTLRILPSEETEGFYIAKLKLK